MLETNEKEYKYLLNDKQFQMILSRCKGKYPFVKHIIQVNYYYDTKENLLNTEKTTVRIRQHLSELKLQIKKHRNSNDSLFISDEYSREIAELPFIIRTNTADDLLLKGSLVTDRTVFLIGQKSLICLDTNIYLGIVDYEVEVEVDEVDISEILDAIDYLDLTSYRPIVNKSGRFFRRLEVLTCE